MKRSILAVIMCAFLGNIMTYGQEISVKRNSWGGKMIKSPFGLGLDVQTKYIWRGMEMMTEDSAPVLFPSLNYSYKGLYIYAMGGYAINGKYAEVDLGISYTWNGLNIGLKIGRAHV